MFLKTFSGHWRAILCGQGDAHHPCERDCNGKSGFHVWAFLSGSLNPTEPIDTLI